MSASIKFQNIIPQIIPTDVTDVYDVVFNVRMPDKVPNPPSGGVAGDDEDFYCNNKLRISLSYLFDKSGKDQLKYFSSTTGQGQQTACVLTPPIEMSKAAAEYSVTETLGTPGTAGTSSLDLVKASGVYFTTYDTLNEKIKKTFEDTYNKLYNGFKTFETINKRTGESLTLAQTCQKYITTASNIKTPVPLIENALTSLAKSSNEALAGITESVTEMEKLKFLDDYFLMVGTTTQDEITKLKTLINVANTAATKADTDVKAYVDAKQKSKEAAAKLVDAKKKSDAAKEKLNENKDKLTDASSAAASLPPPSAPPPGAAATAVKTAEAATAVKTAEAAVKAAEAAVKTAEEEYTQAEADANDANGLVASLENTAKQSNDASFEAIGAAHNDVNALSQQFLPFDMGIFRRNIDGGGDLKQDKYLMNALRKNLLPTNAADSTFKAYKSSYNTESKVSNFLMNSRTVQESIISTTTFSPFTNLSRMQFDFNLYDYQLNSSQDGVTKKVSTTHDPNQQSLLLLLKKNQYFSIVFKNITIPFNVSEILKDTVFVSLEIINTKSIGTLVPAGATQINSQDAFHIFYNFFFPQDPSIFLENRIADPITVKDFFFNETDMKVALESSDKYKDKYDAIQKMSRMFLVYYIKFLGDSFTTEYGQMIKDITAARTTTSSLIPDNLTTATKKGQLSTAVSTANTDIVDFSQKFSFQDIENFRKQFSQALSRELRLTGIAKINDDLVLKILTQMSNKRNTILDPVADESKKTILNKSGEQVSVERVTSIPKDETGVGVVQGDEYSSEQSGGAIPLVNTSTVESWNYIVPMCMASAGSGLNNMVVTIDKKILKEPSMGQSPDFTSVNIQIGDTIRFVNKEGNITYAVVCGFKPGKKTTTKTARFYTIGVKTGLEYTGDEEMDMTDFRKTNIDLIESSQSQKLGLTPLQFLNVTNLRGIRYLPFTYDDTTYSFADSGQRDGAMKSKNLILKAGLKGKFTFRCDIGAIPLLPNGYKYSWGSKALQKMKNFGRSINPLSTQADIGKDMNIPEYSLSSYMTLEKVMTPLNFDPVITYLKKQKDSAINDPDGMIKDLVKIMQDNGLNLTDSCKDKTGKLQTAELEQRKTEFITTANMIRNRFNAECMLNGVVNPDKTVKFIQGLYKEYVEPGILVNEQGIPMQTVPQIIYALSLIPGNVDLNMKLLLLALSQDTTISTFKAQRATLSSKITTERTDDALGDDVLEGGATPDQAKQIIMKSIDTLAAQGFLPPGSADKYRRALNTASIGFDSEEEMKTLQENVAKAKENAVAVVAAQKAARDAQVAQAVPGAKYATSGLSGSDGAGAGASDVAKKGMMDKAKGAMGKLSDFFKPKQSGMGMGAVGAPLFSGDSCGNNTNITCNGEDLIISVSLKLSDIISSCVDPDIIGHINKALDAHANQSNTTNNPPLLAGADAAVEVGGSASVDNSSSRSTKVEPNRSVIDDSSRSANVDDSNRSANVEPIRSAKVEPSIRSGDVDNSSSRSANVDDLSRSGDNQPKKQVKLNSPQSNNDSGSKDVSITDTSAAPAAVLSGSKLSSDAAADSIKPDSSVKPSVSVSSASSELSSDAAAAVLSGSDKPDGSVKLSGPELSSASLDTPIVPAAVLSSLSPGAAAAATSSSPDKPGGSASSELISADSSSRPAAASSGSDKLSGSKPPLISSDAPPPPPPPPPVASGDTSGKGNLLSSIKSLRRDGDDSPRPSSLRATGSRRVEGVDVDASPPASGRRVDTSASAVADRRGDASQPLSMKDELRQGLAKRSAATARPITQDNAASSSDESPPPSVTSSDFPSEDEGNMPGPPSSPPLGASMRTAAQAQAQAEANMQGQTKITYTALTTRISKIPSEIAEKEGLIKTRLAKVEEYDAKPPPATPKERMAQADARRLLGEAKTELAKLKDELKAKQKEKEQIIKSMQKGGSRKRNHNSSSKSKSKSKSKSNSNKSKRNKKSSKRKTRKSASSSSRNKKVRFMK